MNYKEEKREKMLQKLPKPHDPHESYESVYVRFMLDTFPRVVTEDFVCDVTQAIVNGQEAVYTDACAYGNFADPCEVLRLIQERENHGDATGTAVKVQDKGAVPGVAA